jgi:hypothetical protein
MTSTALVPATSGHAIANVNPHVLNYGSGLARGALDEYISSRNYPGEQFGFKNGEYTKGFGKKAVDIPRPFKKVMNVQALMVTWRIWDIRPQLAAYAAEIEASKAEDRPFDPEKAKGRPKLITLPVCYPFAGQRLPDEEEIKAKYGHLPMRPGLNGGKDQVPWERVAVFVIRDEKSDQLDHLMLSSFTGFRAAAQLAATVEDALRVRKPALPVVELSAKRLTKDNMSWYTPTFEIVGWTEIKDCDLPADNAQTMLYDEPPADEAMPDEPVAPKAAIAAPRSPINRAAAVDAEVEEDDLKDAQPVRAPRRRVTPVN